MRKVHDSSSEDATAEATAFLDHLYGDLPDGHFGYLWTLPDRRSEWWRPGTAQEVAALGLSLCERGREVYVGVSFASEAGGPQRRVQAEGDGVLVAGLVACVADIDIGPGHAPTEEAARELVEEAGLLPTCIVHSGGGWHVWWAFQEPLLFADQAERDDAAALVSGWQHHLQQLARTRGWGIDSVGDLARILRLPGTVNYKLRDRPRPVRLVEADWGVRYTSEHFEPWRECAAPNGAAHMQVALEVAEFPWAKHEALRENVPEYAAVWTKTAKHLLGKSQSEWDLALASYAIRAMSPSEVAALLGAYRERHCAGDPKSVAKGRDPDYLRRTIGLVMHQGEQERAREEADEFLATHQPDEVPPNEGLRQVLAVFELPLTRVQLVGGKVPMFRFHVGESVCALPASALALSQDQWAKAMFAHCGVVVRKLGKGSRVTWGEVATWLWSCAEKVDPGADASLDGEFVSYIRDFLGHDVRESPSGTQVPWQHPFARDARVWFRRSELCRYLQHNNVRLSASEVAQNLAALGAVTKTFKVQLRGKATTMSFSGIPAEYRQASVSPCALCTGEENESDAKSGSV